MAFTINPVLFGILATLFSEFIAFIILTIIIAARSDKHNGDK